MKVGFLGIGDMGLPMAHRLAAAGMKLFVWNRDPRKAASLLVHGVRFSESPAEIAAEADIVGLCLTSHAAVEEVVFGPSGLLTHNDRRVRAIADFSTGSVEAAQDFAHRAAALGVEWVDSPVSGGVPAARRGQLIVFAGGKSAAIERLAPLFEPLAARVTRMGDSGSGQATKICNQAMVAANILVMAETVAMARRAGLEVARLADALAGGFADCAPLQIFGRRMAEHEFEPRLAAIALMAKDADLASAFAGRLKADTPILREVQRIYSQISLKGVPASDADVSALIQLYEGETK